MPPTQATARPRPHTGRRRNEEVRRAILRATLRLLGEANEGVPSIEAIAGAAGVGKQTIYRWWTSKAAVIAEAMTEYAQVQVPPSDTGDVSRDLETFLVATFRNGRDPAVANALRAVMAEAQTDASAADVLGRYAAERRAALRAVFERAQTRGDLAPAADLSLLVDQAFGVIWYRLLIGHAPLGKADAVALTRHLVRQATP